MHYLQISKIPRPSLLYIQEKEYRKKKTSFNIPHFTLLPRFRLYPAHSWPAHNVGQVQATERKFGGKDKMGYGGRGVKLRRFGVPESPSGYIHIPLHINTPPAYISSFV